MGWIWDLIVLDPDHCCPFHLASLSVMCCGITLPLGDISSLRSVSGANPGHSHYYFVLYMVYTFLIQDARIINILHIYMIRAPRQVGTQGCNKS